MDKIYLVVEQIVNGDGFSKQFDSLEKAIFHAENSLAHLTEREKKNRSLYILECDNQDSADSFEGDVVKEYL